MYINVVREPVGRFIQHFYEQLDIDNAAQGIQVPQHPHYLTTCTICLYTSQTLKNQLQLYLSYDNLTILTSSLSRLFCRQ